MRASGPLSSIPIPPSAPGIASACLVVKLGSEVADLSETMRETLDQGVDALVARIAQLLRQGAEDGTVRVLEDPETTARMLYAKWLGAAVLAPIDRTHAAVADVAEDPVGADLVGDAGRGGAGGAH